MGNPAPPYGPQYGHGYAFPHPPPPDPPELPEPASRWPAWPWWYSLAAAGLGLVGTFFLAAVILAAATAAGAENAEDSKGYLQGATVGQQVAFMAAAVFMAGRLVRPRAWHFGLRPARFWPTVGWAALGFAAYWLLAILYTALVSPDAEQETLEDLGTEDGTVWVVGAALLVITFAPVAEEFFFRGFFYRSLRTKLPVVAAAVIVGVIFGAIHLGSTPAEILPVLMILGIIFCLVYEKTGTLFSVIGLHSLNNMLAFGVTTDEWAIAGIVGAATLAGCMLAPRLLAPVRASAPGSG
jgi:membrane protease YdiL (CAAX protease family)